MTVNVIISKNTFDVIESKIDVNYFSVFIRNENVGDDSTIVDNSNCYIVLIFKSKSKSGTGTNKRNIHISL